MAQQVPMTKSCESCPSFLRPSETIGRFGKSIGTNMCGRFGYVLGKPDSDPVKQRKGEKAIAKHRAATCFQYGSPMPKLPESYQFEIAIGDTDARSDILDDQDSRKRRVTTCASCVNFVRDDVVNMELGYTVGMCVAKGRLIFPNRQKVEAVNCDYRQFGQPRSTLGRMQLFPEYEDAFGMSANPVSQWLKNQESFVDPKEYVSDLDVDEAASSAGIRAWRKIVDQEQFGEDIYLPIYDTSSFTEEERAKIPQTGDNEHPEDYIDHMNAVYTLGVAWMRLDETPVAWGIAGTGKTEIFRHMAWLMQLPFERFSITGSTEVDHLAGVMHYTPERGTYFQYGRLPLAWRKPCIIVLDEPNTAQPDVWHLLRPLTDNSKQMVLDTNEGERIVKHTDCFMGMAMNPAWDIRNTGVEQIGDADGSRLYHIEFDNPPETLEREIIKKRVGHDGWEIDKKRLDDLMGIAKEIRPLTDDGTLPITWGVRQQIKVARALRWFAPVTAYRRAIADSLEPQVREMILDIVRQNTGDE